MKMGFFIAKLNLLFHVAFGHLSHAFFNGLWETINDESIWDFRLKESKKFVQMATLLSKGE